MRSPLLSRDRVVILKSRDKTEVLTELVDLLSSLPEVEDRSELLRAILQREEDLSTAMGFGFAVPHAKIFSVRDFVMAVGLSREGIEFDAIDGKPVHLVVMIAGPIDRQRRYLQLLSQIMTILRDEEKRRLLTGSCDPEVVYGILKEMK